jgi:hypothetical protein
MQVPAGAADRDRVAPLVGPDTFLVTRCAGRIRPDGCRGIQHGQRDLLKVSTLGYAGAGRRRAGHGILGAHKVELGGPARDGTVGPGNALAGRSAAAAKVMRRLFASCECPFDVKCPLDTRSAVRAMRALSPRASARRQSKDPTRFCGCKSGPGQKGRS